MPLNVLPTLILDPAAGRSLGPCAPAGLRDHAAAALRDGVLQDLVATAMLLSAARARLAVRDVEAAGPLIDDAEATLEDDVDRLRLLIGALERSGTPPAPPGGRTASGVTRG